MVASDASVSRRRWRRHWPWLNAIQFAILVVGLVYFVFKGASSLEYNWQWYRMPRLFYRMVDGELILGPLVDGLLVTFQLTAWALPLAILIGLATAVLRRTDSFAGRALASGYLELIRSTPILVQVYLFYFVAAPIFGVGAFWTCVLALAFHEGAFTAEIFRSGIQSVHRGQWEAADSLGLTRVQCYRDVVLPQAVPIMLPPMTGQIITLVKHSSILSAVAIFDLTTMALDLIAETFMAFEIWLTVGGVYLVVTGSLSLVVGLLEHRIRRRGRA